jgi:hypothetical protein
VTWLSGTRLATLGLLAAALIGLWQASRLESWSFDGPGAGFFPQLVAITCIVLAIVVLVVPGKAGATEDGDTDAVPDTARTNRTFAIYAASFGVLALGSLYAGFVVTTIAVSVLILRFAEGRSWLAALGYGVGAAIIGLVCFGWLLRVDLPISIVEQQFYALVR